MAQHRAIIITGVSRNVGIGAAIARRLAAAGLRRPRHQADAEQDAEAAEQMGGRNRFAQQRRRQCEGAERHDAGKDGGAARFHLR